MKTFKRCKRNWNFLGTHERSKGASEARVLTEAPTQRAVSELLGRVPHGLVDEAGTTDSIREAIVKTKVGLNTAKGETNHVLNVLVLLLERQDSSRVGWRLDCVRLWVRFGTVIVRLVVGPDASVVPRRGILEAIHRVMDGLPGFHAGVDLDVFAVGRHWGLPDGLLVRAG